MDDSNTRLVFFFCFFGLMKRERERVKTEEEKMIEKKNKKLRAGVGGVKVEHGSLNFICFTDKSLDL